MKKTNLLYLSLALVVGMQACENGPPKNFNDQTQVDADGLIFIKAAHEGGLTEIKAGALAKKVSKNKRVINFADMMITQHTKVDKELVAFAADKVVDKVDTLSKKHQVTIDSISKLSGAAFDKAYMNMMVADHEEDIKLFQDAKDIRFKGIQDVVKKALPHLKMHLDSAKAIKASLK